MVAHMDRNAPSSFASFPLYKSVSPPFISLLSTEIYNQSASFIIVRQYSSAIAFVVCPFLPSTFNLVSILFPCKFFKHFVSLALYVSIIPYKPVRVLGFTVTCRSCLMRRVTLRLSAMEQATMKYTHQVTKTMKV